MLAWFKERKYLHFDIPITAKSKSKTIEFVTDPNNISKHSFYPFITYNATKYKIREDEGTGKRFLDDTGVRPISYASHLDAQIYSYYSHQLSALYENRIKSLGLSETVIAFRKLKDKKTGDSKSNIHLARDAFDAIKEIGNCKVYAFDIKSFFDNLNPIVLKQKWEKVLNTKRLPDDHFSVYKSVTKFSVVTKDELYDLFKIPKNYREKGIFRICNPDEFRNHVRGEKAEFIDNSGNEKKGLIQTKRIGIHQGSPISATLANIYMIDFDETLNKKIVSAGGKYFRPPEPEKSLPLGRIRFVPPAC